MILAKIQVRYRLNDDLFIDKGIIPYNRHGQEFYRGMMLDENIISNLLDITNFQIQSQKFAVPLSFMSCSKSQNVAKQFLENQEHRTYEEKVRGFCPVLFKIHVPSLDKTFLDLYKSYYPDSVVSSICTSICAVNIENISKYSEE